MPDINFINDIIMNDSTSQSGDAGLSSISIKPPKDVVFNIHHKFETYNVVISDHATVGK